MNTYTHTHSLTPTNAHEHLYLGFLIIAHLLDELLLLLQVKMETLPSLHAADLLLLVKLLRVEAVSVSYPLSLGRQLPVLHFLLLLLLFKL